MTINKYTTQMITKMYTDIKWIKKSLDGNGGPGLIEQTRLNTDFRLQIKGFIAAIVAISSLVGIGIMWLFNKFKGG